MLLAIDVGNTNTVIGLFDNDILFSDWRIHTESSATEDEFNILVSNLFLTKKVNPSDIQKVIISCVVPEMMRILNAYCNKYLHLDPFWIDAKSVNMPVLYDNPSEVGADRLVNAIAAYHIYRTSLIVIDFGTATTFDVITDKGEYVGGAIAPGIGIASESLFKRASKLPRVDLFNPPPSAIGKNTEHSMKSGIIFGYAELVDGMVRRIKKEMNSPEPRVIATGGLAPLMQNVSSTIEAVELGLTLDGMRIISNQ